MKDYNKENFWRLMKLFASLVIFGLALLAAANSLDIWYYSFPTSGVAIYVAVMLAYKGYYLPEKEAKKESEVKLNSAGKAIDPKTGRFVKR